MQTGPLSSTTLAWAMLCVSDDARHAGLLPWVMWRWDCRQVTFGGTTAVDAVVDGALGRCRRGRYHGGPRSAPPAL